MPARAVFVAGAGTGIGKTYVTAALVRRLLAEGSPVAALKPLASGVPPIDAPDFAESDTAILLAAQGLPVTPETVEAISPWCFAAPLAPDLAAEREGRTLTLEALVAWCRARLTTDADCLGAGPLSRAGEGQGEAPALSGKVAPLTPALSRTGEGAGRVLIEGVGGLMSPVTQDATGLDWLKALDVPALLVSGSYLGAISHALTAVETLRAHAIPLLGVVVSESPEAPTSPETVSDAIARHARVATVALHRGAPCPDALTDLVLAR